MLSEGFLLGLGAFFEVFGLGLGESRLVGEGVFGGEFGVGEGRKFGEFHSINRVSFSNSSLEPIWMESILK